MVECTALEMRHRCKPIGGSNPSLSATVQPSMTTPKQRHIVLLRSRLISIFPWSAQRNQARTRFSDMTDMPGRVRRKEYGEHQEAEGGPNPILADQLARWWARPLPPS